MYAIFFFNLHVERTKTFVRCRCKM